MEIAGRNEKGNRTRIDTLSLPQCWCCYSLNFSLDRVRCCVHNSRLFSGPLEADFFFLALLPLRSIRKERRPLVLGGQLTFQQEIAFLLHQVANRFWSIMVTWSDFSSFLHVSVQLSFLFNRKKPGQSPQCRQCHVRHATMISSFQRFFPLLFDLKWSKILLPVSAIYFFLFWPPWQIKSSRAS